MLFVNCSGELPKHLSPSLRKLIIGAKGGDTHEFSCAIPSEWGEECVQLEELWLANSQIEGTVDFAQRSNTNMLAIELCSPYLLTGRLPESLGRMANLRLLDVRNNNLQGQLGSAETESRLRLAHSRALSP